MIKFILISIILLFTSNLFSQTDSSYIKTDEAIDELIDEPPEEADNEQLFEIFEELIKNPVNINKANVSDLQVIPYVDASLAEIIVNHRKKYGDFFSEQELFAVPELSTETVEKIIPYVKVYEFKPAGKYQYTFFEELRATSNLYIRNRLITDLQENRGFKENKYSGSPAKVYNRIQGTVYENYEFGALAEKDAGEKNFNEFTSYYLSFNNYNFINKIVVGDYLLEFGQGLVLWRPYGFSKGSNAVYPVKKKDRDIKENSSSNENNFFRGTAASFNLGSFDLSAFYSNNKLDANIDTITGEILSTPIDGFHRTEGELSRRKTANERIFGGRIDYSMENSFNTGFVYYNSKFSNPFLSDNPYDLSGTEYNFYSLYYDIYLSSINIFGETAYNSTSVATLAGIQITPFRNFSLITSFRNYPRNFISIHGLGFGERSGATQNEVGFYTGIRWRTPIGLFNFYYDQFKFPYATYTNPLPGNGNEFLLNYELKPIKYLKTRLRYKYEKKDVKENTETLNDLITKRLKQNYRFELTYQLSKQLRLKGRFEYNKFEIHEAKIYEEGFLYYQDIRFLPVENLNIYGRVIFFKTDSFNSAVYEYENNLTGLFTNNAMFGEGMRWYFLVRYKILKFLTLSAKYSETYKPSEKTLGSGNEEIEGNLDNRLSFQLDIRF